MTGKRAALAALVGAILLAAGLASASPLSSGGSPPPPGRTYFGTAPSGQAVSKSGPPVPTGLPRSASFCASHIIRNAWEPRPDNYTANHTVGEGSYPWGGAATDPYWTAWAALVPLVQGQFTGTTTEMFSWAACRWGIDEVVLRAVAAQESHWHMDDLGDVCGPVGRASYGIMQVKNVNCSGQEGWGGYPDTTQSTALNVDFYGAHFRACYDGDFYDGGPWLYNGQTVGQVAAANGWDYVLWGCVGQWFSGGWYDSGAQSYIAHVKAILAERPWRSWR
jgi:hypothetical protein